MIGSADTQDQPAYLSFDAMNTIMKNLKKPQFDYDGFKRIYDENPEIQPLVKNFDSKGITLYTKKEAPSDAPKGQKTDGKVDKMAQRATSKAVA